MKNSLFVRIFLGYAVVILLLAVAVALFGPGPMRQQFDREQEAELRRLAVPVEALVLPYLEGRPSGSLEEYVTAMGRGIAARITVIDPAGRVLADSEQDPIRMENHLYRPEINAALEGREQMSIRLSPTLARNMMYMGFPLKSNGKVIGVLRLSRFMRDLDALFSRLRANLLKTIGIVTLIALGVALYFTRSISRPIREFSRGASRVAAGDFRIKVSMRQQGEFKTFARSFNAMTEELATMFDQVRLQTEELNSVLASLRDGLCVLDASDRIVLCNDSFRRVAQNDHPEEKYYWEVVRSSRFAEIIKRAKESGEGTAEELSLADRVYSASVTNLAAEKRRVVMLHDMTEFKNLERIKKDFVTNVSHELKTPLAAIKGFVETMAPTAGEENRPYLEIIKRNTDRLIAIVEDLLVLSELEEKGTKINKEEVDVRSLVATVLKIFEKRAAEKSLSLAVQADPALPSVTADPFELERLFINLVDNAVKYTDKGSVIIRLAVEKDKLVIEVEDSGAGIPAEHLPHIFERFYVVDKSRSKKLGGTGLGLSIVKHIVLAHRGTISVKSSVGGGTTFTIILPVA